MKYSINTETTNSAVFCSSIYPKKYYSQNLLLFLKRIKYRIKPMTAEIKKPFVNTSFYIWVLLLFLITPIHTSGQISSSIQAKQIRDFKEAPKIKWKFETKSPVFSSPVVSDNLVYFGGLDSLLYAIDIYSGNEKWRFHTNGEIRSDAVIYFNKLYINGGDGFLYALNKENGAILWKFKTNGERKYDFADYFHSTPVLDNNILYFGSGDGNLYAVDSETGNMVWVFKAGDIIHTTPAISNNKIFFGSFDGNVYALNLKNGKLVWKFKTVGHRYFSVGEVQGSPAVFKNLVFIGARDYNVYAIDQEKGFCHWNKSFTKGWGLNNTIHDSILYIGSADERVLISVEPESGKEFWIKNMEFLVFGNIVFSEAMLYVGTTIGKLHGISIKTGENIWSFETNSYLEKRFKYFKADDSYRDDIYSIIKTNEQFLEVECELGGIFSTPFIDNDIIIFSSTNGTLYCLSR
jgi:eukaryotic-like serine/threonine-protein kinase